MLNHLNPKPSKFETVKPSHCRQEAESGGGTGSWSARRSRTMPGSLALGFGPEGFGRRAYNPKGPSSSIVNTSGAQLPTNYC